MAAGRLTAMDPTEIAFAGAAEQARMLAAGEVSARELVELYLDAHRAPANRGSTPSASCWPTGALAEADAAQARLDAGERLPLLGVPVAIKDDVDVAGEVTAWGTSAHGPARTQDAEVVAAAA